MRWLSIRPQMWESRPSAVTKKSGARSVRTRRQKSIARAAASNAGPRLADVAGKARRKERSDEVGREGICDCKPQEQNSKEYHAGVILQARAKQKRKSPAAKGAVR